MCARSLYGVSYICTYIAHARVCTRTGIRTLAVVISVYMYLNIAHTLSLAFVSLSVRPLPPADTHSLAQVLYLCIPRAHTQSFTCVCARAHTCVWARAHV